MHPAYPNLQSKGQVHTYGLHGGSFFGITLEDPKFEPQKGTTMEPLGSCQRGRWEKEGQGGVGERWSSLDCTVHELASGFVHGDASVYSAPAPVDHATSMIAGEVNEHHQRINPRNLKPKTLQLGFCSDMETAVRTCRSLATKWTMAEPKELL